MADVTFFSSYGLGGWRSIGASQLKSEGRLSCGSDNGARTNHTVLGFELKSHRGAQWELGTSLP